MFLSICLFVCFYIFAVALLLPHCSGNVIRTLSSEQQKAFNWDNERPLCGNLTITDPLWDEQWYLYKSNRTSYDLNVLPAWERCYNGSGIVVAVVDGGMYDNDDLTIDRNISYDPFPAEKHDLKHGTRVAGIIAAHMNDKSGVGIAFESTIADIRMLIGHATSKTEAAALTASLNYVDIYSNSFNHFPGGFKIYPQSEEVAEAIKTGVQKGRNGKGAIYVWSTGNGGGTFFADSCAFEGFCNSISVIAVAGIQHDLSKMPTGEECSAIMIAAFSRDPNDNDFTIITTDGLNETSDTFGRNSAAVPMVSGAIALALQANPNLGYRDVMHLLVRTARGDLPYKVYDFQTNGAGFNVSSTFGFGLLDIGALVKRSLSWVNVPHYTQCSSVLKSNTSFMLNTCIELNLPKSTCVIDSLEHVVVHIRFSSKRAGHVKVYVTSPSGTKSLLLPGRFLDSRNLMDINVTSVQFWGENPIGKWYLTVEDNREIEGEIEEWVLYFTGINGRSDLAVDICNDTFTMQQDCKPIEVIQSTTTKVETTTTPATSERHDVLCETDTITAFIPEDLLPAGAELTWRDPNCTLASNSSHFLSTISHNQCGTSVSINTDSVVFENEILLSTKSNVSSTTVNTMVDFGNIPAVIPVKCVYPRKQMSMLSYQPIPSVVRFYEKNNGHLEIKMETYKTNQFRETLHGLPVRIRLQSDVYIRVSLEKHSSNIGLRLEKCIATKSPLPYDKDVYTLIENGCPVPSHVKILQSPSTEARFSFKAFEFVNNNTAPVYIHCEAVVCQAGSPDCATNCRNQLRQRRDLGHNRHSHLITTGPLVLETDKESNLQVSTILAGVFALVAVGAIIVAVVGWRRKPLANNVDKS